MAFVRAGLYSTCTKHQMEQYMKSAASSRRLLRMGYQSFDLRTGSTTEEKIFDVLLIRAIHSLFLLLTKSNHSEYMVVPDSQSTIPR
eukprot:2358488-Rhodomonas_salina.2